MKYAAPRPGHERNLLSLPCADLRAPANLLNWINLIWAVQSSLQKYFCFRTPQITSRTFRIPSHTEGRIMIVTNVGAGCGGRGSVLRAMGSQGGFFESVSDQRAGGREMLLRTAKSCGPDAPTLASSFADGKSAQPGADKPDIRWRRWQKSPVTGESTT